MCVKCFNGDMQQLAEEVSRHVHLLNSEPGSSFTGPSEVGLMPLPLSARTQTLITAAPIYLGDTTDAGGPDASG